MRKVAPDSPGSAASQNSWSVLKLKPMAFKRTITVLQTIHTAKANSSAGMEIHRLRRAVCLPLRPQKAGSSGRQSWMTGPFSGVCRTDMFFSLGNAGKRGWAGRRLFTQQRALAHLAEVHPDQRDPDHAVEQHEAGRAYAGEVHQGAKHDRQHETTQAAGQADD